MLASLESKNSTLTALFSIPLIGTPIYMLLILVPAQIAATLLVSWADLSGDVATYYLLLAGSLDLFLWTRGTKFRLFFLPFWLLLFSLGIVTLLWTPPNNWPPAVG